MSPGSPRFYYDFVDPLSFAMEGEIAGVEDTGGPAVERVALELRPPPLPLVDPTEPGWRARWTAALAGWRGDTPPTPPPFVPWTRKAHELVALARDHVHPRDPALLRRLRDAIFRAALVEGRDVGRIDVLVDLAAAEGLDRTHVKAVLDVDRHAAAVERARAEADRLGVAAPPAIAHGGRVLRGFHNRDAVRTFLAAFPPPHPD